MLKPRCRTKYSQTSKTQAIGISRSLTGPVAMCLFFQLKIMNRSDLISSPRNLQTRERV